MQSVKVTETEQEKLIAQAISLSKAYEKAYKERWNETFDENISYLLFDGMEYEAYSYHLQLSSLLSVIAQPEVQKVLLQHTTDYSLSDDIKLIFKLSRFFQFMTDEHHEVVVQRMNLELCGSQYGENNLLFLIEQLGKKIKVLKEDREPMEA